MGYTGWLVVQVEPTNVSFFLQSKIEKLKIKVEALESERDNLKESEADLEGKVSQRWYLS